MIKNILAGVLLSIGFLATAQEVEDTTGKFIVGGTGLLSFSNTGYGDYFAGGGTSSTNLDTDINVYGNRKFEGDKTWENNLLVKYGIAKTANTNDGNFIKAADVLDLSSKFGMPVKNYDNFYYTAAFNFLSQLTETNTAWSEDLNAYQPLTGTLPTATNLGTTQSGFLAPADLTLSFGIDYKPNEHFSTFFGPVSSKLRVINDDNIAKSGLFGNEVRSLTDYENTRYEAGANMIMNYNQTFLQNDMLGFITKLTLFSDYLDNPDNVDVNWNTTTSLNPWKFISINYSTDLRYDDNKRFTTYADGEEIGGTKQGIQFMNNLGIGLTYKFGAEK